MQLTRWPKYPLKSVLTLDRLSLDYIPWPPFLGTFIFWKLAIVSLFLVSLRCKFSSTEECFSQGAESHPLEMESSEKIRRSHISDMSVGG